MLINIISLDKIEQNQKNNNKETWVFFLKKHKYKLKERRQESFVKMNNLSFLTLKPKNKTYFISILN